MDINVAISINHKFLRYAYVMLMSLFSNNADNNVNIHLLHSDLNYDDMLLLKQLSEKFEQRIFFYYIDNEYFPKDMPTTIDWSLEIYYRLLISDILPENVDRVLYIDADVIVNESLEELYQMDFEGNVICACENMGDLNFGEYRKKMFEGHFEKGYVYVASGLLLLNLVELRKEESFKRYLEVAQKFEYKLEMPDMDIINYVHAGEIKVLDKYRYQIFAMQAYTEGMHYSDAIKSMIVHFPGHKPWQGGGVHFDIEQLWWEYARYSPFFVELMQEYLLESLNDGFVFNKIKSLTAEKYELRKELDEALVICNKLMGAIDDGEGN